MMMVYRIEKNTSDYNGLMSMLVRLRIPVVTFVLKNKLPSMEGNQYKTIST